MAAVAHGFWSRTLAEPGLLLKRLVLAVGAVYFTMVAATNAVNFIASVGDFHWTFLNSGNAAYVALVTNTYSWLMWTDNAAVLAAALAEGFGALLFGRALLRFRGEAVGIRAVWLALGWNIAVWLGFIVGTEFFVAYKSEGPFRELLVIALLMPVIIAVVPDRIADDHAGRQVPSARPARCQRRPPRSRDPGWSHHRRSPARGSIQGWPRGLLLAAPVTARSPWPRWPERSRGLRPRPCRGHASRRRRTRPRAGP
jgi:hypothetical protein